MRIVELVTRGFVAWVVALSALAYLLPAPFAALKPGIVPGLGLIMFGMGITLVPADFRRVAAMPRAVACGFIGQFGIMPLTAWALGHAFGLSDELAMGFVLLGCCPGGTASNVIAYLARADVALSVTMTACSTLAAVVLTPFGVWALGGTLLEVDPVAMLKSLVQIVLLPVGLGLGLRQLLGARATRVVDVFPAISVVVIVLVIACIVGLSHDRIASGVGVVGAVVVLMNVIGLALGYGLATLFRLPVEARRTVAIEVGMQNSGLGVALATKHFAAQVLVALPSSLFSVVHNLSGSALAGWWGRTEERVDTGLSRP